MAALRNAVPSDLDSIITRCRAEGLVFDTVALTDAVERGEVEYTKAFADAKVEHPTARRERKTREEARTADLLPHFRAFMEEGQHAPDCGCEERMCRWALEAYKRGVDHPALLVGVALLANLDMVSLPGGLLGAILQGLDGLRDAAKRSDAAPRRVGEFLAKRFPGRKARAYARDLVELREEWSSMEVVREA